MATGVAVDIAHWNDAPNYFAPNFTDEQWNQSTGIYYNYPFTQTGPNPDFHPNMDGSQAAYLFAAPLVELSQTLTDPLAVYTPGVSYKLSLDVIGAGGGMPDGVTLGYALYYFNGGGQRTIFSESSVVMSPALDDRTNFTNFSFTSPEVLAGDAWAGRTIGILIYSKTPLTGEESDFNNGYWDVDNVRLQAVPEPGVAGWLVAAGAGWGLRRRRAPRHA